MNKTEIIFAPVGNRHTPAHPNRIVIRRPLSYAQGRGSATAIRVEAYAYLGPKVVEWDVDGRHDLIYSEPIYTELIWVTRDHRQTWDQTTGGRCGARPNPPGDYVTGPDLGVLQDVIGRAVNLIDQFHESHMCG